MRVLVLGGAGFLGSYVVDELVRGGHEVTVFDRIRSENVPATLAFIEGNVLDRTAVERAVAGHEVVYHFAGQADIGRSIADPLATLEVNILGTSFTLEACRNQGVRRFVFASTSYVFSHAGGFYGVSKAASERLIEEYHQQFGLEYTIIRYGSVYGERADEKNRIYRILKQALSERRIVFPGDGTEEREYIHAKDAASLSVGILAPEYRNMHVILSGIERFRYSELLNLIREMLGQDIAIEYLNQDYLGHYKLTPYSFLPKLSRKMVNNPSIDLGQGLLECLRVIHQSQLAEQGPDVASRLVET